MYAVVLAGGGGTRLWPLSRPERPKPFLPLLGPRTLLQQTVDRLSPLVEPRDLYVVTDQRYVDLVRGQLSEVPREHVLGEPVGRNTAAAVALGAVAFDRATDDLMTILPADHEVRDAAGFRESLAAAGELASRGALVTLGIAPDGPATRFGYILRSGSPTRVDGRDTYAVERFVEKPDEQKAIALLERGAYWNAGIFVWRRDEVLGGLRRHAADILEPLEKAFQRGDALVDTYPTLRAISVDYALLEPASLEGKVRVVPTAVGWSDIGSWGALLEAIGNGRVARSVSASRVLQPGDEAVATADDLLLYRDNGRLVVAPGSGESVKCETTTALLVGARGQADDVDALIERVVSMEQAG